MDFYLINTTTNETFRLVGDTCRMSRYVFKINT